MRNVVEVSGGQVGCDKREEGGVGRRRLVKSGRGMVKGGSSVV